MKRTYVDSGVLIAAARGIDAIAQRAMNILDDPEREFVSSVFVKLEVLPKSIYHHQAIEVEFYTTFFDSVAVWADNFARIAELAYKEACQTGINALDALHIAAAASVGVEEFITSERPTKPLHRAKTVRIVSIYADDTISSLGTITHDNLDQTPQ
jgi:predicted nucleic acid-binding protein